MQNNSTQVFSDEGHCRFHLHVKNCEDNVFYSVIYYTSIILAVMLAITAGGLWLKRRLYIKSSQKVAFLDGYLLWQTLHASTRIISDIIILSNLIEGEYMILELLYDIPFYCDQVSVILFILGILLAIPHAGPSNYPATPSSQRSFQIFIPSHNSIIWFFRIFSFLIFPSLAVFALLTGYFHSVLNVRPDEKSHFVHLEKNMIRAHYIVYAVSYVSIAICFAYFGRKVKRFAEGSIGLLMDIEMDSTRYGRLRLMRRSITRMNIVNGFLCAKYLLFSIGATLAAFQLDLFSTDWISELAAVLVTTLPLVSMILCTLLILYGDTNPEEAFDTHFSQTPHSQHNFLTWDRTMESPNQQDKTEFSLLPPPPSYKDDDTSQQDVLVQETEQKQHNANRHSNSTTISTNQRLSRIHNSTILPDIIVSSPSEIAAVEKNANRIGGKSKFVAAWILDQHERTSTTNLSN